jgi:hypothetical protein
MMMPPKQLLPNVADIDELLTKRSEYFWGIRHTFSVNRRGIPNAKLGKKKLTSKSPLAQSNVDNVLRKSDCVSVGVRAKSGR